MIKINNKAVVLEDYECEILPYYFNKEQKKRAEGGERIFVVAKKYYFEILKTEHKTIDYYETLMLEFLRDDNKTKSLEGTELLYHFISYDWEGIGMSEVDDEGMFNITAYCDYNKNIVVVKTDVFEYGLAAALSIVKQIVSAEEENNDENK